MKNLNPPSLTLPPDVEHVPYGREYTNSNEAQIAIQQFQEELDKLLVRFGIHCFIFNGSVVLKPLSAPLPTEDGASLAGLIRSRAVCRADGCAACAMFAVAQGAILNPDQNKILATAYAMIEQGLGKQAEAAAAEQVARDFHTLDVKGPKQ
jgi:hypothetical protein